MQEFYMNCVKEMLKKYTYAVDFIKYGTWQIEELKTKKESVETSSYGTSPTAGGGSSQEDKILNINSKMHMLKKNINNNNEIVKDVEYGLIGLSDSEQEITLCIYGYPKKSNKIKYLSSKYHYEKSQLYNIARSGLEHISYRLYGDA